MWLTIAILIISAVLFANGKIRSDIVALCALCALLVFQILTPAEALSGFSNSVVIMMVGLFVVGGAIFQTGLAKMISSRILKLAGKSETRLFLLVMLVTAGIGGFAQAYEIGKAFSEANGCGDAFIDYLRKNYDAQVLVKGVISNYSLTPQEG